MTFGGCGRLELADNVEKIDVGTEGSASGINGGSKTKSGGPPRFANDICLLRKPSYLRMQESTKVD